MHRPCKLRWVSTRANLLYLKTCAKRFRAVLEDELGCEQHTFLQVRPYIIDGRSSIWVNITQISIGLPSLRHCVESEEEV